MKKRLLTNFCLLLVLAFLAVGCTPAATTGTTTAKPTGATTTQGTATTTGAPEPVTLNVITAIGSFYGDSNEMTYWKEIANETGVTFVFEHVSQNANERLSLMFTSGDFPDIAMNGPTDAQIQSVIDNGLIYEMSALIDQYSPNWKAFFAENDYARKVSTMPDGKIWSLPIVRDEDSNSGIRDQWMINVQWMRELNLSMPKTTDEFYTYLKGLKDNAGKGTIPADVIPWCVWYNQYANGGLYELFNAFGVFSGQNFTSVDPNGKVVFSVIDPGMKEAIKYVGKLYAEGLVLPDMFTMDAATFDAKTSLAKPPISGSYLRYFNDDPTNQVYDVLPAMTSPFNSTPMYRSQANATVLRNKFTIFTKCQHPEAAMRVADLIATPDWSMQAMYGMYGDWLIKNADGSVTQKPVVGNEAYQNVPGNSVPFILTMDFMKDFTYVGSQQQRAQNIANVYKKATVAPERLFPNVVWQPADLTTMTQVRTDLMEYANKTFADWIVNGFSDGDWDTFVSKTKSLGLDTYISLHQKYLDDFNK
jgi:putative aldouronate transport system substrate-binding protein